MSRPEIVEEARSWLGTRYHHQGRIKGVGVDCGGVVVGVAQALNIPIADLSHYSPLPDGEQLEAACEENLIRIPTTEIEPGDVILFRFSEHPQHLAIAGDYPEGGLSIIHAFAPSRRVIEVRLDEIWFGRIYAAYRFPEAV